MKFKGVFVGIDRYNSPQINWLDCAKKDAVAMHALFKDSFGEEAVLLTDETATKSEIQKEFENLVNCEVDDFIVFYYSGHGSDTHELITYDANPYDFPNTAISLDLLTKWFSLISAKKIICILDCCFSGGMGAKAFQMGDTSRDARSEDNLLSQLSGEGRLIFTASAADEKSWENQKIGHGWMTYYLIEALQGAEEVRQEGKIGIYQLLDYVTRRVVDATSKRGKKQNPTVRGTIDGSFTLPLLKPGEAYFAAFPNDAPQKITEDLQSLTHYGFPAELISSWGKTISKLNALQIAAVNEFKLLEGENLVVSAPTSSGKTMIGELVALHGSLSRKRTVFLFPLKALVNDKHKHFNATYSSYGLRTVRATGESTMDDMKPLMRGQYDICLMTYEKFASIALSNPYILDQISTVVVDEVQMITDKSRGVNLEFILTLLRMRRAEGIDPQIICLSAVIGDSNGFERWLNARLLLRKERPVPLDEGIIRYDGSFRYINSETSTEQITSGYVSLEWGKGSDQDLIKPLVKKLVSENKQVLVFREKTGEATGCANYLAEILGLPPAQDVINQLPDGDPSVASNKLRQALERGVGFHISHLEPSERLIVEEEFRKPNSKIRVISATTTLSMGINTPAEAVVISGLQHPDGNPYSIAEYKNMVGRAGRLGIVDRGSSFLVVLNPSEEQYYWTHYILGIPEDLTSRFLSSKTDPRSLILRVLVGAQKTAQQGLRKEDIINFLNESFGAFQQRFTNPLWEWQKERIEQSLDQLLTHNLVKLESDHYTLEPLGRLSGETGVEVESILRLIQAFSGEDPSNISDQTLLTATQITVELDEVLFPINKKSTQKEPTTWIGELRRQNITSGVINGLHRHISDQMQTTLRAKKAVSCLLWITDKSMEEIENILTQFGGRFDGAAGPIRNVRARTCDLLPTVIKVAEILYPGLDLATRGSKLLIRLETGAPSIMVYLASYAGTELTRGDYLKLFRKGITSIDRLKATSATDLLNVLGNDKNKLTFVRRAIEDFEKEQKEEQENANLKPILPQYQS